MNVRAKKDKQTPEQRAWFKYIKAKENISHTKSVQSFNAGWKAAMEYAIACRVGK